MEDPIREVERESAAAAERSHDREDDEDHKDVVAEEDILCADCNHPKKHHWGLYAHCEMIFIEASALGSGEVAPRGIRSGRCPCEMFDDGLKSYCCKSTVHSRKNGIGVCLTCGAPVEIRKC